MLCLLVVVYSLEILSINTFIIITGGTFIVLVVYSLEFLSKNSFIIITGGTFIV